MSRAAHHHSAPAYSKSGGGGGGGSHFHDTYRASGGPHRNATDGTWSEFVPIPIDLADWAAVPAHREATEALLRQKVPGLTLVGYSRTRPSEARFELRAVEQQDVRIAAGILQLRLSHQEELQKLARRKELAAADIRALEDEVERGLRVEFTVPNELLGLVIGKGGANMKRVEELTGVDCITIHDEVSPPVVRVRGPTPEAVAEARRHLEFVSRELELTAEQSVWVLGPEGATIADIRLKSKVTRMDIDKAVTAVAPRVPGTPPYTHKLTIIGLKADVALAEALVDAQIEYQLEYRELAASEEEARAKLRAMDLKFDAPRSRGGGGGGGGGGGAGGPPRSSGPGREYVGGAAAVSRAAGPPAPAPSRAAAPYAPAPAPSPAPAPPRPSQQQQQHPRAGGGRGVGAPPAAPAAKAVSAAAAAASEADADLDRAGGAGRRRRHDDVEDDDAPAAPAAAAGAGGAPYRGRGGGRGGARR